MKKSLDPFKNDVIKAILWAIESEFKEKCRLEDIESQLAKTPKREMGDLCIPCFFLAKKLKKNPNAIAEDLSQALNKKKHIYISKTSFIGAYLNFHCSYESYLKELSKTFFLENRSKVIDENSEFQKRCYLVEYSQPNTHKFLHVGHLRCLILGDAVSHLLESQGARVVRITYPGDNGAHVAKLLWHLTHPYKKELPRDNKAKWLGLMYSEANSTLKEELASKHKEEVLLELRKIRDELFFESGDYYELWKTTRQWSLSELETVYKWFHVEFDKWYFESECERPSIDFVKEKYSEGLFIKDKGAIGLDLSEWGLGFAMFLKSDGHGLYLTKDLELMNRKFKDYPATHSIYVVDERQKLHFKQLFKTAELIDLKGASNSYHLSYATVNTEKGKAFSSRDMNGLCLWELKEKIEAKVKSEYLSRYNGLWSEEEISKVAADVTLGALKYGFLKVDNNTQVNFNLDEWLRLDGDTGPYLQYVHSRCQSVLKKFSLDKNFKDFHISMDDEKEIILAFSDFKSSLNMAATQLRPSVLTHYLFELAKLFNRFYEHCSIKESDDKVKQTRLYIVYIMKEILFMGLSVLGIPAPHKM